MKYILHYSYGDDREEREDIVEEHVLPPALAAFFTPLGGPEIEVIELEVSYADDTHLTVTARD